jgi:hypothetical protein
MGIRDRPISARSPWQNGYAERLIGSIRRDCLDHVVVLGERHLRHLLASYQRYYNEARTHLSLGKDAPASREVQAIGRVLPNRSWAGCIINTCEFEFPTRTTAPFSPESQSFLDNVIAEFADVRAWNDRLNP